MKTKYSFCPACYCRKCIFCDRIFVAYQTVRTRQYACRRKECQALRQRFNELEWHRRHQYHDDKWYRDYYRQWRQRQPDYQKRYRHQMKMLSDSVKAQIRRARQKLKCRLRGFQMFQTEYKKQLHEFEQRTLATARIANAKPAICALD